MKDVKVPITAEQGNVLFNQAATFALPEKLGETPYSIADRRMAGDDAGDLCAELKSRSPRYIKDRQILFGPSDNWTEKEEEVPGTSPPQKTKYMTLVDPKLKVEIRVTDNARHGAFWCLLLMLHPDTQGRIRAGNQEEVVWPLADAFRLRGMLQKELGIENKARRELRLDAVPGESTVKEPEAPAPENTAAPAAKKKDESPVKAGSA